MADETLMRLIDAYADAAFDQGLHQRTEDGEPESKRQAIVKYLAATPTPADRVPMPTNADQAAAMALLGEAWLRENAPERLKAATPAPAPHGWKLVPVEPTPEMLWALFGSFVGQLTAGERKRYAAMLAAAPGQGKEASPQ